jgi:anti-sigma regulatory factor (Ser/Thr protein kinase)/DNA-binding MarR family transcriptional regulator
MKVVNQASAQVEIRKLIENHLQKKGEVRAAEIIRKTGLSRTYVNRILQQLQREGRVRPIGKANRARYVVLQSVNQALASELSFHRILKNQHLEEDIVLDQIKAETGIFNDVPVNVTRIVEYGFTEMLNNAIEHSRSERIIVRMERTPTGIWFTVVDYGIGVFKNVMITRKLASEQEAIQDLLKGKQTTVPDRHTGEGIFFTSKASDSLEIKSSNKKLLFDNHVGDAFVRDVKARKGTQIDFWIALDSPRELEAVFRGYTSEELAFDRTTVAVKLYKMDSGFVSRSQARRVLAGLEKFKTIALDFANVTLVGQGFIDEVFRVWRSHHPEKVIEVRNADQNVQFMIDRHLATQQKS